MSTILQSSLLTNFLYPLLLIFFIVFAVLEKSNLFGEGRSQLNSAVALIVGLIFVGLVFPILIVENLVLYMAVGLIVIFVGLMLWGFLSGNGNGITVKDKGIHKMFAFLIIGATLFALLWATGYGSTFVDYLSNFFNTLFSSDWSSAFWTNVVTIGIILAAVAIVTGWNPFKSDGKFWWIK